MYAEGKSTSEIAMLANVSARYIRMVLTDNNVPRRAIGSWKRKYDIKEDYFKTWSNNMAYILGFIVADGAIPKENQCVSISQKESYILEDIKRIKHQPATLSKQKTDVYMLNINSKTIKDDLMNIHGIMPCKSLNIKLHTAYEAKMIFSGDNSPSIKIKGTKLQYLLVMLHLGSVKI